MSSDTAAESKNSGANRVLESRSDQSESSSEEEISNSPDSTSEDESDAESTSLENSSDEEEEPQIQPQPSLRERIQAFLPQIREANEALLASGKQQDAGFELKHEDLDDEDEGYSSDSAEADDQGPYIEMNLGLGVLEEVDPKDPDDHVLLQDRSKNANVAATKRKAEQQELENTNEHVMEKLTSVSGRRRKKPRNEIEELNSSRGDT